MNIDNFHPQILNVGLARMNANYISFHPLPVTATHAADFSHIIIYIFILKVSLAARYTRSTTFIEQLASDACHAFTLQFKEIIGYSIYIPYHVLTQRRRLVPTAISIHGGRNLHRCFTRIERVCLAAWITPMPCESRNTATPVDVLGKVDRRTGIITPSVDVMASQALRDDVRRRRNIESRGHFYAKSRRAKIKNSPLPPCRHTPQSLLFRQAEQH